MKKRLLSLFLVLCMVCALLPASAFADEMTFVDLPTGVANITVPESDIEDDTTVVDAFKEYCIDNIKNSCEIVLVDYKKQDDTYHTWIVTVNAEEQTATAVDGGYTNLLGVLDSANNHQDIYDWWVYGSYEAIVTNYTVSFNVNGHGTAPEAQTVESGSTAAKPADPTEEGWVFCGWYADSALTQPFYFTTPITENTTVYAMWKKPITEATATITTPVAGQYPDITPVSGDDTQYTVGGETSLTEAKWYVDSVEYNKNTEFTAGTEYTPHIAFRAKAGYCFTDSTVFKINGITAEAVACTGNPMSIRVAKLTFTASASATYTVSFNTNGHGTAPDAQTIESGSTALKPEAPTAAGWKFGGWFTDAKCTGAFDFSTPITADTTLYAKWSLQAPTISISRSGGKPKISWKAVPSATRYYIYRSTDGKKYEYLTSTTKTSVTNTKASSGKKYYYKVKAVAVVDDKKIYSAYSNVKYMVTTLKAPTVSITRSSGHPKISWKAVTGADKYIVYYSTNGKSYSKLITTKKLTVTNTKAKAGKTYYYKVKAVSNKSSNATSAYSKVVSIKAK